jgi:hypothetical protein
MLVCVVELTRKIFVNFISVGMQISLSRMDMKPRILPSFHVGITGHRFVVCRGMSYGL